MSLEISSEIWNWPERSLARIQAHDRDHMPSQGTEYSHNNSGGYDWLDSQQWFALHEAGWRLFGWDAARPTRAAIDLPMAEAIANWRAATGQDPDAQGCECCGPPHSFQEI